jgi:pimeloyl-ACP methyl ester carboxylesterase
MASESEAVEHTAALPDPLPGTRRELASEAGRLAYYTNADEPGVANLDGPPLLLLHSINAAASAYEVRPVYLHFRPRRPVYALDLPGFGHSERSPRPYLPRLMTDAILATVREIQSRHGHEPVDAFALSLSSEFLARAAVEQPQSFRTLALVSPTGFGARGPREGEPGENRGMPWLHRTLAQPLWRRGLFRLLASRKSIRYFLRRTYGSHEIDEDLVDYDYATTHQPGAEHAPLYFLSGFLFSTDVGRLYRALEMPVWMTHGVRGDFTDYRHKQEFEDASNWRFHVFDSGALPHFEYPVEFVERYQEFLANPAGSA